jgi:hypothetical protein
VDDAVEDGIGEGGLGNNFVPLVDRELACDEGRASTVAVLDDLHQITSLAWSEPVRSPVIEDQQIGLDQGAEQPRETAVTMSKLQIGEQARDARKCTL